MKRAVPCLLSLLVFSACSKAHNDPAARGKALFASYECTKCHAVGGEGNRLGPDLTLVGFRKSAEFLDTWLKDPRAWKKNVSMPNFYFQDNVREDIVAYLASLRGQDYGTARPWDDAEGLEKGKLVFEHAGCITCHGKGGTGGYPNNNAVGGLVPAVNLVADGFSRDELIEKIAEGVASPAKADPAQPAPLLYMPTWRDALSEEEIGAVADYLLSLKPKSAGGEDEW